jgi:hypothetical protein
MAVRSRPSAIGSGWHVLLRRRGSLFQLSLRQSPRYLRLCRGRALVAADPPLSRWRATNPMPAERVAAPAPMATGPASPRPDPIIHGPAPSGCADVAPGLASPPQPPLSQSLRWCHTPPSGMAASSLLWRIASRHRRFGSTLPSTSSLTLMRRRKNLGWPAPRLRTILVLRLRWARWRRGVQWSSAPHPLRQGIPRWWFVSQLGHMSSSCQMSETRSSSVQVVLPQCIPYELWHGKVAKTFKARPPEFVARRLGPAVPSCRQARLAGMKFLR